MILRPYEGTVRIARRIFLSLLDQRPTPERYIEALHLRRIRFEIIAERKLRRRQLTKTGDVEISGRDLRERTPPVGQGSLFETRGPLKPSLNPSSLGRGETVLPPRADPHPERNYLQSDAIRVLEQYGVIARCPCVLSRAANDGRAHLVEYSGAFIHILT